MPNAVCIVSFKIVYMLTNVWLIIKKLTPRILNIINFTSSKKLLVHNLSWTKIETEHNT